MHARVWPPRRCCIQLRCPVPTSPLQRRSIRLSAMPPPEPHQLAVSRAISRAWTGHRAPAGALTMSAAPLRCWRRYVLLRHLCLSYSRSSQSCREASTLHQSMDAPCCSAAPASSSVYARHQGKSRSQNWAVLGGRFGQPSGICWGLDGDGPRFRPPEGSLSTFLQRWRIQFCALAGKTLCHGALAAQPALRHQ